ncbi:MAG TPA: hypothetical protein VGK14_06430 [Novimethylophilus sp.]|jgi:hypothetical protein|uniref:hypothetical protein n=1 Tax=Novimethylophilus sp. TaxID=2137426 RepID=UPI002F42073A
MMKKLGLILAVSLFGCSTPPRSDHADHREWIGITCSGFAGWDACYYQAGKFCRSGYEMAYKEENLITQKRSVLVACKP